MSVESLSGPSSSASSEEDPRAIAANLVHALYRLIKGCLLHDDSNQALVPLVESVIETTRDLVRRTKAPSASVLFANNSVFVNRQMLRASRETYQIALDLGALLVPCNVTEVTLHPGIETSEVGEFGRAVAAMNREKKLTPLFAEGGWSHLKVRKVFGFGGGEVLPALTRVARTYAASILIMRSFYADQRKGKLELSHGVKRVAQKISGALDDEKRLLLSTAAAPPADADRAGVAVSTAIIAVLVAAQLTEDRTALTNLAMAALLYDTARVRLARSDDVAVLRNLNEDEEERLPASGLVMLTALGKLHPPAIVRSAILYEALCLRSSTTAPYGGARSPHVLSRILAVARAFSELRVARGSSAPLSMDDAIDVIKGQATDNTTKSLVKLLVGALGVFPAGTMVELSTGELAVVVATPRFPIDFARPPVRIMYDATATLLEEPIDVDLASPPKGSPLRVIKKPVDASDQQLKQMRAYVMSFAKKSAPTAPAKVQDAPSSSGSGSSKQRAYEPPPTTPPPRSRLAAQALRDVELRGPTSRAPDSKLRRPAVDPRKDDDAPPPSDVVASRPQPVPALVQPEIIARKSSLPPPPPASDQREVEIPVSSAPRSPIRSPEPPRVELALPVESDPRSQDGDANARRKVQGFGRKPPPPAPPPTIPREAPPVEKEHTSSTRQIDWSKAPIEATEERARASETDAILARYLADSPSAQGGDQVDRDSRGSAGLRWDRSSAGKRVFESSSGAADPPSAHRRAGADRSTGGLRWGAESSLDRAPVPPVPSSEKRDKPVAPPPQPEATPESTATPSRAKAGSQAWGSRRRDDK